MGRLEVLETGPKVWERFAGMKARQKKIGQKVGDLDLLIAATASSHGLTVATLNHSDFERIEGLAWENWGTLEYLGLCRRGAACLQTAG